MDEVLPPQQYHAPLPTLYIYCAQVYKSMEEQSSVEPYGPPFGDREGLIYTGFLTKLIKVEHNLAVPYYTKITRELKRMGCVIQIQRGGSTTPSRWALLHPPTPELWNSSVGLDKRLQLSKDAQGQQIQDLVARVNELEAFKAALLEPADKSDWDGT